MDFLYRGVRIWYETAGTSGPDVLMLHGWGCDHTIFSPFIPALCGSRRITSVDLPGFGQSDEPDGVWGVEDYALAVEALCREAGIVKPHVVGHSFGGRVAIVLASKGLTGRIVLTDSAGVKPRHGISWHIKVGAYKAAKWWLLSVRKDSAAFERYRSGRGSSDYRNASPRMKAVLSKVVGEDLCSIMPRISVPTLLFWGSEDTATPLSDARRMSGLIPDSGLVVVQGADHYSFLRDPAKYAAVLDSFLV